MPPRKQRTPALRARISAEALDLLERGGPAGLRAREVASAAGTSTAAVYELFGDKDGLVRSLREGGFDQLRVDLEAVPQSDDPTEDLRVLFQAMRRFGRARPRLFEVMFSRPLDELAPGEDDQRTSDLLLALVVDRVRAWLDHEGSDADPVEVARVLISTNRGLVIDEGVGWLSGGTITSPARRWNLTFDALLAGIVGQARTSP